MSAEGVGKLSTNKGDSMNSEIKGKCQVEPLVKCSCGGIAQTHPGPLFGLYVECISCGKRTKIQGTRKSVVSSWNYDGFNK